MASSGDPTVANVTDEFDTDELTGDGDETLPEDEDDGSTVLGSVRFTGLSPTEFEEFCFDLLSESGFHNVDWRKGTPKNASPSDRGRDLVAIRTLSDVDGHKFDERWFVDCKHYSRGVPPDALQGTIAWAQAERPDTVLFVASGFLTNGAKDWIAKFLETRPPFRIRVWEMPQLRHLLMDRLDIAFKHDVETAALRRVSEVIAVEQELSDKLWYGRKPGWDQEVPADWAPELVEGMREAQREMEEKYGVEELESHVESDWAWGVLSGKVSAIRWILGYEWDMLDS